MRSAVAVTTAVQPERELKRENNAAAPERQRWGHLSTTFAVGPTAVVSKRCRLGTAGRYKPGAGRLMTSWDASAVVAQAACGRGSPGGISW